MEEKRNNQNTAPVFGKKLPPRPMPPRPIPPKPVQENLVEDNSSDIQTDSLTNNKKTKESNKKTKPVKKEKVKLPKIKKEKVKLSKKTKALIISCVFGFVLLAGAITGTVFYVISCKKLDTPKNLEVYKVGTSFYAECDNVENSYEYLFTIAYNGKTYELPPTLIPRIDLTQYIQNVGDYTVKVRVKGKNDKSISSANKIIYKAQNKLDAPEISYVTKDDKQYISFIPVSYANQYAIYYCTIENEPKIINYELKENVLYDLSSLFTEVGYYNIKVRARTDNENYIESDFSNELVVTHTKKQDKINIEDIVYDKLNQTIKINGEIKKFDIKLTINDLSLNKERVETLRINGENNILDLKPYNIIKENDKLAKIEVIVIGEGFYKNSDAVVKVIE